jgi:ferrous iron transport protein B
MADFTIALAGNPNAGKSTIFNSLTGLRQHTGNWPGKTVEKKVGTRVYQGKQLEFVDLPGTYSLAAYSPDEFIARDFIINDHPDAIICVVDATNLERNLYLVVQLLELDLPLVIALNMSDQTRSRGIDIDIAQLSNLLGNIPVVATAARKGHGIDRLLEATIEYIGQNRTNGSNNECSCGSQDQFKIDYGAAIESAIHQVEITTETNQIPLNGACSRWLAMKLIEDEADIVAGVKEEVNGQAVAKVAASQAADLIAEFGDDVDIVMADRRYSIISDIQRQVIHKSGNVGATITERIDGIVTNRLIGLPIFLAVMYLVFRLVIDVSAPFLDWIDNVINGPVAGGASALLTLIGSPLWLHSLVIEGVIAGVGGILTFIPGLIVLFFFLAILEDSGYLARAAFVMDRFMRFIGLHGKSVIPLMLGFGCAVPAVYATRTIANPRNRLLTALLIPFMSCAARLPVYVVFALAFFGSRAGNVIWIMYVLGVVAAIIVGFILSRTVLKADQETAFVLELPPYRMPTFNGLMIHTWENTKEFVQKAGTVILAISIILWMLLNLPWGVEDQQESLFGSLSQVVTPILEPAGFGNWESSGALITGLIAKELVVSSLSQMYVDPAVGVDAGEQSPSLSFSESAKSIILGFGQAVADAGKTLLSLLPGINLLEEGKAGEDTTLSQALQLHFSPLTALSFLVFVLLYIPCIATMSAIKQEFGGRWAVSAAIYQTFFAWLAAVLIFQGGRLIGFS